MSIDLLIFHGRIVKITARCAHWIGSSGISNKRKTQAEPYIRPGRGHGAPGGTSSS